MALKLELPSTYATMTQAQRRAFQREVIARFPSVPRQELADALGVSRVTIYRDVHALGLDNKNRSAAQRSRSAWHGKVSVSRCGQPEVNYGLWDEDWNLLYWGASVAGVEARLGNNGHWGTERKPGWGQDLIRYAVETAVPEDIWTAEKEYIHSLHPPYNTICGGGCPGGVIDRSVPVDTELLAKLRAEHQERIFVDHPQCYERLVELHKTGQRVRRACVSTEDVTGRSDAMKFADAHVPMALEPLSAELPPSTENPGNLIDTSLVYSPAQVALVGQFADKLLEPQPPKRVRRTPEQVAADKAAKLEEKERKAAERAAARAALKLQKAMDRVAAKEAAKVQKLLEAEGGHVALPALVSRKAPGEIPVVRELSDVDAWSVIKLYLDHLFVDCETSGYPLGHQLYELRTVQLGGEEMAVVFDASDPEQMKIVALALELATKISAHSAAADAIPLVAAGLITWEAIWAKMHDSVLYLKLIDPKLSGSDAAKLKEVAGDLLPGYAVSPAAEKAKNALFKAMGCLVETDITTPVDKNGWACVNRNSVVMTVYAGSDVLDLAAVMRVLPELPVGADVLERERWFEAKCARVAYDGFRLDVEHIKLKIEEHEKAFKQTQADVLVLSDYKITNPKSPEVAGALIELFPEISLGASKTTGNPSAAKKELEKVKGIAKEANPLLYHLAGQILDHRHHSTTLSLLLRPLENLCDFGDGRMRPTVYTINADTGRCSCVRPNGQQFSRQGGIRQCVCADSGWVMCNADFQGCEIRVAAGLSGDAHMLAAEIEPFCHKCQRLTYLGDECSCGVKTGDNGELEVAGHTGLHWLAAHETFGNDATKEHRYKSKAVIFRKMFGGAPDSEVAVRIAHAFDTRVAPVYADWDKWLRNCYYEGKMVWRDYATGQNFSQDLEGKRRGIYRTYSGRNIYINAPHAFGNYAIQGTARELLVDGVIRWSSTPWGDLPLLPIHDELLTWVRREDFQEATAALKRCMETDVLSSPGFEVHIGADPELIPYTYWPDSS